MTKDVSDEERLRRARRVRLWEDTIVLSLRDAQWLRCQEHEAQRTRDQTATKKKPLRPQGLIKFDGRAESRLGDVSMGVGERYFLIEVKPAPNQVRDEWTKNGRFMPKKVYATLSRLLAQCEGKDFYSDQTAAVKLLRSSLRGHLVVYWAGQRADPLKNTEWSLVLSPYLQAVRQSVREDDNLQPGVITRLPMKAAFAVTPQSDKFRLASPLDLGRDDCVMAYMESDEKLNQGGPLGLEADEFQRYINHLCQDAGNATSGGEPINAIMLSSHGSFFQVVRDTSELALILSEMFVQRARPQQERKPRQVPEQESNQDIENDLSGR